MESVKPLISSFSHNIVHCGEVVGSGHAVKAVNNTLMAANLWSAAEGMLLLKRYGVDLSHALDAINGSSGRSWATMQRMGHQMNNRATLYNYLYCYS